MKLNMLKDLLKNENADFSILFDKQSLKTAKEGAAHYGISLCESTPTLVLKNEGKYLAAIICGNTKISFKTLKILLKEKELTLANPQDVFNLTGANIGEVSLINLNLETIIDSKVLNNIYCYGGCGIPQTTLKIKTTDLIRITQASVIDFTKIKESI